LADHIGFRLVNPDLPDSNSIQQQHEQSILQGEIQSKLCLFNPNIKVYKPAQSQTEEKRFVSFQLLNYFMAIRTDL
jgi:hypothetical protein